MPKETLLVSAPGSLIPIGVVRAVRGRGGVPTPTSSRGSSPAPSGDASGGTRKGTSSRERQESLDL
jgi:hypothetical protein